jgi:hypothetical protein
MKKNFAIIMNINLSKIPKEKLKKAKNGDIYTTIRAGFLKEPDENGHDMYVAVNQSKEERETNKDITFMGRGKTFEFNNIEKVKDMQPLGEDDDLPF